MKTGWLLLLIALLCTAAPLALCQQKMLPKFAGHFADKIHHPDKSPKGKYDGDYAGGALRRERSFAAAKDNDDPKLSQDLAAIKNNRAAEITRSITSSGKFVQPDRLPNSSKPRLRPHERPRQMGYKSFNISIGDGICKGVDIRNNVLNFAIMRECRVIEGSLQIVLIENSSEEDFQNITFPKLNEITGYLLLYRVNGLKSLSNLFPNLEVIRGNVLLTDYALIIYEMQSLQEVGLKKLTKISRGGVRIEKNPSLCYTTTMNWNLIVPAGEYVIKDNREEASCPGCSHCPSGYCWTAHHCQRIEKPDCHEQCLGECKGPSDSECYVCKHYRHEGKCVEKCPSHLYTYLSRRCITNHQCLGLNPVRRTPAIEEEQIWRPFNGTCKTQCPDGYEDAMENNVTICRLCQAHCRKIKRGKIIRHISDAQEYRGVKVVKGALEFQIRNGNPNIMNELSDAFGLIEEITEYVKVKHSFPITSLAFFKKLKVIRGTKLDKNNASLSVLDNPNLSSLFPPSQQIKIENGRFFFHYNPKLCLSKIEELGRMTNIVNFTDLEVQPESNGEKVACNVVNINITVRDKGPDYADLVWDSYEPPKGQDLLSYLLNYIETNNENITYEANACGNNTWQVLDVDIPRDNSTVSKHITNLKPHAMYAAYVKTFMARNKNFINPVGQSEIIFFRTKSTIPSPPVNVVTSSLSDSKISLTWDPPFYPNGPIGYYMISSTPMPEDLEHISMRDYCLNTLDKVAEDYDIHRDVIIKPPKVSSTSCCSKDSNPSFSVASRRFEIFCYKNTTLTHISPGWKDHCVDNNYNSDDNQFYEMTDNLSKLGQRPEDPSKTELLKYDDHRFDKRTVMHNISGDSDSYVLKDLRHYTRYIVTIAACGVKVDNSHMCSSIQYSTSRTKARNDADNIGNVNVDVTNNTIVEITWEPVRDPNALTVTYTIEYTNINLKDAKRVTKCIPSEHKGKLNTYFIRISTPGKYSLRMRSTSLAGDGAFTELIYFSTDPSDHGPITVISLLTLAVLTASFIVLYLFFRNHQKKRQERLIASVNPDYVETKYIIDGWEVPRDSVEIVEEFGLGNFGMVYRGIYDRTTPVAIKTIAEDASQRTKNEFLNEASVMKNFSTFHIIKLLGVVSTENPPFVIMELMENGDLKSYLRSIRDTHLVPDAMRITRMAAEIADGMAYLESKKYVHRDLAARNCMVSKDLVCKIGDFGMARDIYETDYYKIGRKGLLPIRWMAPENLADGVFTSDSDVWSFGVVLYEILTLAEIPYQGLANSEVLSYVLRKGTLNIPPDCPVRIQKMMEKCFKWRPSERPTFMEIVTELEPFLGQDFCERSFYHSAEGVESRNSGIKKPYHPAAPTRLHWGNHWGNESARWVKDCEDHHVTLLDQTKAGTSRARIFKNGFQSFGNVTLEDVPLD